MSRDLSRRTLLTLMAVAASAPAAYAQATRPSGSKVAVEVWKDPNCGCCKDWLTHMQQSGFTVTVHETGNAAVRSRLGIAQQFDSCHTAVVGGYALEGHVPAREVRKLLAEKPVAIGLSVPGMPIGSPGMDGDAYGGRKQPFEVLLLAKDGSSNVYQRYEGSKS